MADYNIYLHAVNTGASNSPTTPWSQKEGGGSSQTTIDGGSGSGASGLSFSRMAAFAQNPDSAISSGFGMMSKALPWVAAAYAAVKIGISITENVIEFREIESGDHRASTEWGNVKQALNIALHPFSSTIQNLKTVAQWKKQDETARMNQDLVGGSVMNSYTRRGV